MEINIWDKFPSISNQRYEEIMNFEIQTPFQDPSLMEIMEKRQVSIFANGCYMCRNYARRRINFIFYYFERGIRKVAFDVYFNICGICDRNMRIKGIMPPPNIQVSPSRIVIIDERLTQDEIDEYYNWGKISINHSCIYGIKTERGLTTYPIFRVRCNCMSSFTLSDFESYVNRTRICPLVELFANSNYELFHTTNGYMITITKDKITCSKGTITIIYTDKYQVISGMDSKYGLREFSSFKNVLAWIDGKI
jgi:hypothetical protein